MKFFVAIVFALFLGGSLAQAQELVHPSEVLNVQTVPRDGAIDISWDESTDADGVVIGYKIYYGTSPVLTGDDSYDDEIMVNSQTTYTLEGLTNDVEYFMAITAVDDEENQSETYSEEISATPMGTGEEVLEEEPPLDTEVIEVSLENTGAVDNLSPTILSVTPMSLRSFKITFSEAILFAPGSQPFVLYDSETFVILKASSIEPSTGGTNEVTIQLKAPGMEAGKNYLITVTFSAEDIDGNKFASGKGDSLEFIAQMGPSEDGPVETLPVEEILDDPVNEETFSSAPLVDTKAPFDATNLKVDTSLSQSEGVVRLQWDKSLDLDEDVIDQVLYTRINLGAWDEGYSLGKDLDDLDFEVQPSASYEVRLVTIDQSGNRSNGLVQTFSTTLAKSGPESSVAALGALILVLAGWTMSRRRWA
jgi:hypothetical protein